MNLHLTRFCKSIEHGTFGRLIDIDSGASLCYTVERPWLPSSRYPYGKPYLSCVPVGGYKLVPFDSPRFGKTWALSAPDLEVYPRHEDMPTEAGRFACLIHAANWAHDVQGCIGVGQSMGFGKTKLMVTNSKDTTEALIEMLGWSGEHSLVITEGQV